MIVIKSHIKARETIKKYYPNIKVGITLSLHDIQAINGGEERANKEWNDEFTHYIPYLKDDDFFGLQNYSRTLIGPDGPEQQEGKKLTQMGYENYPESLGHVIDRVYNELGLPILITENGIATSDDNERVEFIDRALDGVKICINKGIPVLGYMHWSTLDNFEWQKGFSMTFGLISVNRKTMQRTPKNSLYHLGKKVKLFN